MNQVLTYCPTCTEKCDSHPEICTVCGDYLIAEPQQRTDNWARSNDDRRNISFQSLPMPMPMSFNNGVNVQVAGAEWETPTAEAMDPQQVRSKSNPTSKECLKRMPRITIDPHSAILYEASVQIEVAHQNQEIGKNRNSSVEKKVKHTFDATIGEFPPHPPFHLNGKLELCQSIHGALLKPPSTYESISHDINSSSRERKSKGILYMERGGSLTFVEKARNAKAMGAQAVICGNNVPIWPYMMKDSTNKAVYDDIPILMVKRSDGRIIKQLLKHAQDASDATYIETKPNTNSNTNTTSSACTDINVTVKAKKSSNSCIICTEGFQVGSTVIRLPLCGHVFHEECALNWLTMHNTCPFCRRELPAEDKEYESERRRRGRSHAGSRDDNDNAGLAEDQWESIFG